MPFLSMSTPPGTEKIAKAMKPKKGRSPAMKPESWYSSFAKPTRVPTASTKPMTKKAKKIGIVRSFIACLLARGAPAPGAAEAMRDARGASMVRRFDRAAAVPLVQAAAALQEQSGEVALHWSPFGEGPPVELELAVRPADEVVDDRRALRGRGRWRRRSARAGRRCGPSGCRGGRRAPPSAG